MSNFQPRPRIINTDYWMDISGRFVYVYVVYQVYVSGGPGAVEVHVIPGVRLPRCEQHRGIGWAQLNTT